MTPTEYKNKMYEYKGQLSSLQNLHSSELASNKKLAQDALDAEMASDIIQMVGRQTQENLSFRIENLVTAGLEYVFDDPYQFKVEFDTKNNRTQCELFFERNGFKAHPVNDSGGGILDVASISMRIAMWTLQTIRSSPLFILDEPGKFISVDGRPQFSLFLKSMCDNLGVQMIVSTHLEDLVGGSDNIIHITKNGKYSKIGDNNGNV